MPQLATLKDDINDGKTAKLIFSGISTTVTVLIKKVGSDYIRQRIISGKRAYPHEVPPLKTEPYLDWSTLLAAIDDTQTMYVDWQVCSDPLKDYTLPAKEDTDGGSQAN